MIGTCFPLSRPAAPNVSTSHTRGALNGRALTAAPPASPRISRHSSWWAALTQGGFKGLHQWMVRTRQDRGLSVEERTSKPAEIALAIRCMLQTGNVNASQWAATLHDASWYEVDVDTVIGDALAQMKSVDLTALKTACQNDKSFAWLAGKLDKRQAASIALKAQLEQAVEKSMALSIDKFPIGGHTQKTHWNEAARFFESSFGCNLEESVQNVVADASVSKLLPLEKHYLAGETKNADLLNELCKQAFSTIKNGKTIIWSSLSDSELGIFSELVKHDDLINLAGALKIEMERREHIAKRHEVASYFNARLSELAGNSSPGQKVEPCASARLPCPKLPGDQISDIVASVIAKAAPEIVLLVSKLESRSSKDNQLIDAAKKQLETPVANALEHDHLLAYLNLPEESISASARKLLVKEAKGRAQKAGAASMEILAQAIASGSCRKLVGAVLEFEKLDRIKSDLRKAADIDVLPGSETLTDFFSKLDPDKILELQHLAIQLKDHGQTDLANRLSSFINKLKRQKYTMPSTREAQAMKVAVSSYFPKTAGEYAGPTLTAVDEEFKEKYFSALLTSHYDENLVRKAKSDTEDLPVSIQFLKDQRSRVVRVGNKPVDGHAIPDEINANIRRTREFVNVMRGEKFTEAQIMVASRIACQNSANLLAVLIFDEQMYALTDAEREQGGVAAKSMGNAGLAPSGLGYEANVVKNADGNMTVHLEIFEENIEKWFGKRPEEALSTNPFTSSYLSKLTFVIDEKGEFLPEETIFKTAYQREITQYGPED